MVSITGHSSAGWKPDKRYWEWIRAGVKANVFLVVANDGSEDRNLNGCWAATSVKMSKASAFLADSYGSNEVKEFIAGAGASDPRVREAIGIYTYNSSQNDPWGKWNRACTSLGSTGILIQDVPASPMKLAAIRNLIIRSAKLFGT